MERFSKIKSRVPKGRCQSWIWSIYGQ